MTRSDKGVQLRFEDGSFQSFDSVVLAVHANQALALIDDGATELERSILGSFKTSRNVCFLHSDTTVSGLPSLGTTSRDERLVSLTIWQYLPKRLSTRAAWNLFLGPSMEMGQESDTERSRPYHQSASKTVSITFDMNRLQAIPFPGEPESPGRVLVTMNPTRSPRLVQSSHVYYHPVITSESVLMTRRIHSINGIAGISFAGAWMGFGFHEDGFAAGVHAARICMDGRDKCPPLNLIPDDTNRHLTRFGLIQWFLRLGALIVWRLLGLQGM